MEKYFKLAFLFCKMNLSKEMVYRMNLVWTFFSTLIFLVTYFFSFKFAFNKVSSIGGYDFKDFFLLVVMTQTWAAIYFVFTRRNLILLQDSIVNGYFDIWLLKPLKLSKYFIFININWTEVAFAVIASSYLLFEVFRVHPTILEFIGFLYFFVNALWIIHSITLLFVALSFWRGRNNAIFEISIEIPALVQLPMSLYPFVLKVSFVFFIPIIPLLNPSFQIAFTNTYDSWLLITAFFLGPILHFISKVVWTNGLKSYSSAN